MFGLLVLCFYAMGSFVFKVESDSSKWETSLTSIVKLEEKMKAMLYEAMSFSKMDMHTQVVNSTIIIIACI